MTLRDKELHLCSCNGTMPLDAAALAHILELAGPLPTHTQLCQKELAAFAERSEGDTLVACTQEQARFGEIAAEAGKTQRLVFVNIRETAAWSARLLTPTTSLPSAPPLMPRARP